MKKDFMDKPLFWITVFAIGMGVLTFVTIKNGGWSWNPLG